MLFPTKGQVIYVLLTRPPLSPLRGTVRLACIRHAASVCPEPGSNSPNKDSRKPVTQASRKCRLEETDWMNYLVVSLTTLQLLRFVTGTASGQKETGGHFRRRATITMNQTF